jgi:hypothetical protein
MRFRLSYGKIDKNGKHNNHTQHNNDDNDNGLSAGETRGFTYRSLWKVSISWSTYKNV